MKLKVISTLTLLCLSAIVSAQGIEFTEGKTFSEVLALAKEQGKLVFMDCYTSWCVPCKRMANEEFVKKEAGDYFNPRFVNLKMDMEKGEGPELADRYDVSAYPTFLILEPDGTLRGRTVGSASIDAFIQKIEALVAEEKGLGWYQKKFNGGERDEQFLKEYIGLLRQNYMHGELKNMAIALLEGKTGAQIASDATLYKYFETGELNPDDDLFLAVYRERATVAARQGEAAVQALDEAWKQKAMWCMKFDGKKYLGFDNDMFNAYKQKMADNNVPNIAAIVDNTLLANASYAEDYPTVCQYLAKDMKLGGTLIDNYKGLSLVTDLAEACKDDKRVMKTVKKFIAKRIALLQKVDTSSEQVFTDRDGNKFTRTSNLIRQYQEVLGKK